MGGPGGGQYLQGEGVEMGGRIFEIRDPLLVKIVGLDKEAPRERYPDRYDPSALAPPDERFVASFMRRGMRDPVEVWKDKDADPPLLICMGGRTRLIAMREAHRRLRKKGAEFLPPIKARRWTAPLEIERDPVQRALDIVDANLRADRPAMQVAEHVRHLRDLGATDQQIADAFHWKTPKTVEGYLALLEVPACVKQAVEHGTIAADVARSFVDMGAKEAQERLAEMQKNGAVRGHRAKAIARGATPTGRRVRKRKQIEAKLAEIEGKDGAAEEHTVAQALRWVLGEDVDL